MKKSIVIAVGAVLVGVSMGGIATMYFTQWREPSATYASTDDVELAEIRDSLDDYISDLRAQGKYRCCIKNDCKWCAIYMGHCPCMEIVMEKGAEKSCPECAAAWNQKQGRIPGVDADAIQVTTFGVYGFEKDGHHGPEKESEENVKHD